MKVIKPPKWYRDLERFSLFLSGSIEQGKAENWQERLTEHLKDLDIVVYNPRRDDWDATWEQRIDFDRFREQVEWELYHIEIADVVAVYFEPTTKSPITLLELGILSQQKPSSTIVFCPEGFWRKGNVDIVCRRYKITNCVSWEDFVYEIKQKLRGRTL